MMHEGLAIPGREGVPLLILEDNQRLPPGGAVHAMPSNITAPARRLVPQVSHIREIPTLEEALPHLGDGTLDPWFVPGVTHPGRIGDEAAVL